MRIRIPLATIILTAVLLLAVSGQAARLTDAAGNATPAQTPAQEGRTPAQAGQAMVTIDFRDVDVRVVAKFISELTGRNFIFDKQVNDKVTVYSPTEVTPEEAYRLFETVLKVHGYTTVPTGNVTLILPSQTARTTDVETRQRAPEQAQSKDDRVVTQLIRLKHADAAEMRGLLQPLMAKSGIMMSYDSGNTLIVTDYASNIDRLIQILQSIDVPDEGSRMAIIQLKHASAKEMARNLQEVLKGPAVTQAQPQGKAKSPTGNGKNYIVVPDERTNSLIIMARQADIETISSLAATLDIPNPRGSDRVHVYFLKNAVAEDLAQTLSELTGKVGPKATGTAEQTGAAPTPLLLQEEVFISADKATNSLIVRAERQDYVVIQDIIQKLDIQRAQVLVEGVVMEMSIKKANSLGTELSGLNVPDSADDRVGFGSTSFPQSSGSTGLLRQLATNPLSSPTGLILGVAEGTLTWGGTTYLNIGALVRALEQDTDVNILSTPHLLTMDNEEARIVVGEERPFLKSSMSTATGTVNPTQTNTYEFKDLGLTLKITPHITQGEYVKLKILQELKSFVSEAETGAVTSTKRETETTVQVKNKETVVISGMIQDEQREGKNQVPCLGSIPGLGWAFKAREQSANKLNLLILIKPTIIRNADELSDLTKQKQKESEDAGRPETEGEEFPARGFRMLEDN
jgi:general secretion pathway protein D